MKPLFILEMANNHMGDVAHGVALVRAMAEAVADFADFDLAFKLQYRNLDTFIHPSVRGCEDIKYVKRFEETRLSREDFDRLLAEIRTAGFLTVCTPFDEPSVDLIEQQGIERVKIASCSFTDWPLLERIARTDRPLIASTAGASLEDMDRVVSFFLHRGKSLTLMHCVAEYPTPDESLRLAQIEVLRERYPGVCIGFSTHERPDRLEPVMMAIAKGATVFEKHVALPGERYPVNAYSATPEQVRAWLAAAGRAFAMCGPRERPEPSAVEQANLHDLRRGVYAARDVAPGETLETRDVVFAFPPAAGQLTANDWSKYTSYVAREPITMNAPVLTRQVEIYHRRDEVLQAVEAVKALLRQGNIVAPGRSDLEISHHYGMERFPEYGLTMMTVVNREYCKKLLVMLPGQEHPEQYHHQKEETFIVLHGSMTLWLDGEPRDYQTGDVITVGREVRHRFRTEIGVVFEEISSTHYQDDSFYTDPAIMANRHRKTLLSYWM